VKRLWLLAIAILLGGCVSTTSVVQERFAKEHGCPKESVVVGELEGTRYGVRGCDKEAICVCSNTLGAFKGGVQCVEQGLPTPAYRERDNPAPPGPDPGILR
jgi:hypothetical protein